ncbi:putative endonuclease [Ulvibacter sp. MAR_2010_11]|uniref:GIY-YIG nuclease family protein n=1 Tax=Ulvibacter sp. MAR_2010_11 TaxID=1250229 RepID=UPI000C2BBEFB|nr:GIY-YIG nuclease family protein [Ulvibacter sp. MAR_2010_11]PKA83442.1 putative endonuclease [Ulvibacter sp. MAR_2010_11]
MNSYYIYILKCADGLLYTGLTNDIARRLLEHQNGLNKTSFTFKRRPVELIFHQELNDIRQAIYFEKKIKRWSAKKKMSLADHDFNMLQILAECRNFTHHKYRPTEEEVSTALDRTNN